METTRRFGFGANWRKFNDSLDDEQREIARRALKATLGDISGLRFLDVGAGSGLFTDAALVLGAHVRSFDFDPSRPDIERGDVLDPNYMQSLGRFDIVYAWGVLHHTGDMWRALDNAAAAVVPGGRLFVSIYNDQGRRSGKWRAVKRFYNTIPRVLRPLYVALIMAPNELRALVILTLRRQNYFASWSTDSRGMRRWRDMVDWVGGYPFEVAMPEQVFEFCRSRGFTLEYLRTNRGGMGCNEYVFRRSSEV